MIPSPHVGLHLEGAPVQLQCEVTLQFTHPTYVSALGSEPPSQPSREL